MTTNKKIKKIREAFCGDSNIKFAKIMGVSRQTANNWVRDGYSVGAGVLYKILDKFPQISKSWLFDDLGDMLKSDKDMPANIGQEPSERTVPYFLYKELEEKADALLKENARLQTENAHLRGLLADNGITYKQTGSE